MGFKIHLEKRWLTFKRKMMENSEIRLIVWQCFNHKMEFLNQNGFQRISTEIVKVVV